VTFANVSTPLRFGASGVAWVFDLYFSNGGFK